MNKEEFIAANGGLGVVAPRPREWSRPTPESQEPRQIQEPQGGDSSWEEVVCVMRRHYHEPDVDAARAFYAAVAAHDLAGQPVWPMVVAPPSTMKTELIAALDGLEHVHSLDCLTPKTFISGQLRDPQKAGLTDPPSSFLHRMGPNGIVLCRDLSTILAIKADDRNAILADLRRIYDGELKKEFGTSETVPIWQGRMTLVAGVTPDIDKHYGVIQSLGDRFVMIRWRRVGEEAALVAITQDLKRAKDELRAAVHKIFKSQPSVEPDVPSTILARLAALADFSVRARSHVPRGGSDKSIIGEPEAESAPRLAQQLCQLTKGSARLGGRRCVSANDFDTAKRVGFDCIPARRRSLIDWAIEGGKIGSTPSTKRYDREDLQALGLVEDDHLSSLALDLLLKINGVPHKNSPQHE